MNQLNDFLNEMTRVAEVISTIDCPDEAVTYFKTQYNLLESKSELIGNDLDSLFELSSKERIQFKNKTAIKIEAINDLFRTNQSKYERSGYYDWKTGDELRKYNDLFDLLRKFMQNLGSTHSKNYPYELLKKEYENFNRNPNVDFGNEISLKHIDIYKLSNCLAPYFKDPNELYSALIGNKPKKPLIYTREPQTELLYVFNTLKLDNKIVETRGQICEWLVKHFLFKDKNTGEFVSPKYKSMYDQYKDNTDLIPEKYSILQDIREIYPEK